ncbi:hypothetical protein HDR61_00735 [bacterium]|nr:hypothetical protein [bacterium]
MKTGYTNKSKYSLVATAARDGHRLMSVVLGAENKDVRASVSTNLLNKGFNMLGTNAAPVTKTTPVTAPVQAPAPSAQPKPKPVVTVPATSGSAGVQFGAFSSEAAAAAQVARVQSAIGITPVVEPNGSGMYRVRANGLSEGSASDIKSRATAAGIDCYIFH